MKTWTKRLYDAVVKKLAEISKPKSSCEAEGPSAGAPEIAAKPS